MDGKQLQEIGNRIQTRRKQLGLTQEQLAEAMNVSIQMVSNLERGNKAIRIDNLVNLSRILNISTDYILMGQETASDMQGLAVQIAALPDKSRRMIEMLIDYCMNDKN